MQTATDKDYFLVVVPRMTRVILRGMTFDVSPRNTSKQMIRCRLVDASGVEVPAHVSEPMFSGAMNWWEFLGVGADPPRGIPGCQVTGRLQAGTYWLEVSGDGAEENLAYAVSAARWHGQEAQERFRDDCAAIATEFGDPLLGCGWHHENAGQFSGVAGVDINVAPVWRAGNLGEGVPIAIVDDGLDAEHEDLAPNVDAARSRDYTDWGLFWWDRADAGDSHGTAVAGLAAARDNDVGGRGVAPRATIRAYNLLRNYSDANLADRGASTERRRRAARAARRGRRSR